ncbi:MAG: hypothetical protein COA79_13260 [Planctomycetota bacterium]|nr:MAG: hypothetical protein COA79_13260 [Planctomycetota bacterium]
MQSKLVVPQVLIVDDFMENLIMIRDIVSSINGVETTIFNNGIDALKALEEKEFALILLDVDMPGMNGFEVAENIKKLNLPITLPIIFITGKDLSGSNAIKGYSSGAVDYILKPFDNNILMSKIRVFLELYKQTKALELEVLQRIQTESKLQSLFDGVPECVCALTRKGMINEMNPAGLCLLDEENLEDVLGLNFLDFIENEDETNFLKDLDSAFDGIGAYNQYKILSSQKNIKWVDINIVPLKSSTNSKETVLCLALDVTEKREVQIKLKESEDELYHQKMELEKKNITLNELHQKAELKYFEIEERIKTNSTKLLVPILERMEAISPGNKKYCEMIINTLNELSNSFTHKFTHELSNLSPKEIEICHLIRNGMSSRGISNSLSLSERTIHTHRNNIRKKLGIARKGINLTTHLQSI